MTCEIVVSRLKMDATLTKLMNEELSSTSSKQPEKYH